MGLSAKPTKATQSVNGLSHIRTFSAKQLRENERTIRVAVIGDAATGKTQTALSLIESLIKQGLKPDEILFEFIDLDAGLIELLDQAVFPDEYLERINYTLCSNFTELVDTTHLAYERLAEHVKEHGVKGAWIIIDDTTKAWSFAMDDYCRAAYGMPLVERMKTARATQIAAKKKGQKGEPIFNKQLDFGTISPMHNDWANSFLTCGFNTLWLSPWKIEETKDKDGTITDTRIRFGQSGNAGRISYIIKKYFDVQGNRRADFIKSRATKGLPRGLVDTSWDNMFNELEKLRQLEQRTRESEMKKQHPELFVKPTKELTAEEPLKSKNLDW